MDVREHANLSGDLTAGVSLKWHLGLELVLRTHSSPGDPARSEEFHANRLLRESHKNTSLPLDRPLLTLSAAFLKGLVTK